MSLIVFLSKLLLGLEMINTNKVDEGPVNNGKSYNKLITDTLLNYEILHFPKQYIFEQGNPKCAKCNQEEIQAKAGLTA